mmetsp:Transcript_11296/g.21211  ORF Transcript_11296/g.21211 Transcript_11296/m.21211 type:complete len:552 (+) Transcript_11296:140-1795(+)
MDVEEDTCPLCLEELDVTDKHIDFCQCGYRMCLWCWHRIMENAAKDNLPGLCPNCRQEYDKDRITKGQVDPTQLAKEQEKKRKEAKAKLKYKPGDGVSRKHLQNVRVIQRNLVYAIGIPLKHCKEDTLRKQEFFGKYGKILKISVNRNGPTGRYAVYNSHSNGSGPTGSAYVTFMREGDAVGCIKRIDGSDLDGHVVRACFGTTKYCNAFLKYQPCNNPDCLYLHEIGEHADSFTKEEMARIGTKHHSFHELTNPPNGGASNVQGNNQNNSNLFATVQRRQELGVNVVENALVCGKDGANLNGDLHPKSGEALPSQGSEGNNHPKVATLLPMPQGMPTNHFTQHPASTSYPHNAAFLGNNERNGFGNGDISNNTVGLQNSSHQTTFSTSYQEFARPASQMSAGEMFLSHISQQMMLGGQANEDAASTNGNGSQGGNVGVSGQTIRQEEGENLGSGLGGLFGVSGGGYNFDLSGNRNGFHILPGVHQTVTEIESKMMTKQQLDSSLMNGGTARTTSRFSFANRNSEAGQTDGRSSVKSGTTNSICVPPGFSA